MNVDKYCDDGLLFDVYYNMENGGQSVSKFMFTIDDTEKSVQEILTSAPYNMDVIEIIEGDYVLKLKQKERKYEKK